MRISGSRFSGFAFCVIMGLWRGFRGFFEEGLGLTSLRISRVVVS